MLALIERVVLALRMLPVGASDEQLARLAARVRHGRLALAGLVAFNAFYCFAGQPTLSYLPGWAVTAWGLAVVFASTAIFMRRVRRREQEHARERFAQKLLANWER